MNRTNGKIVTQFFFFFILLGCVLFLEKYDIKYLCCYRFFLRVNCTCQREIRRNGGIRKPRMAPMNSFGLTKLTLKQVNLHVSEYIRRDEREAQLISTMSKRFYSFFLFETNDNRKTTSIYSDIFFYSCSFAASVILAG